MVLPPKAQLAVTDLLDHAFCGELVDFLILEAQEACVHFTVILAD
jgi:hypothetical protein